MKNFLYLNVGPIVALIVVTNIVYYLLLHDNCLHTSIASILNETHNLPFRPHLLVLGFIPIYIAFMIFGAGSLSIYLGSALQQIVARFFKKK